MTFEEFVHRIEATFEPIGVSDVDGEFGAVANSDREIERVAYATNLDPITAAQAVALGVDALVTHHDAWDFLLGLRSEAHGILADDGISHVFVHLPLDAAPFGTAATLAERLGLRIKKPFAVFEGLPCGRVGRLDRPIPIADLANRLRAVTAAAVRTWTFGPRRVERIGVTTGAGSLTDVIEEAVDLGCDTYVTGESSLYAVQYARYRKINLIVGTHTQTELPGVAHLCDRIASDTGLEFIEIPEGDFESGRLTDRS